ncbi:alpha/beta-hydrolase [Phellopilus nigrolimitatus]|nr:alpha/beta-hydrolase [Phellopilus nigrolimitatus]
MGTFLRETIKIPSVEPNVNLDVWLYKPAKPGPFPVVVAGHGLTVLKSAGYAAFGERWAADAGYASLILDYRYFGNSDGEPRNLVVLKKQLDDYCAVINWARQHSELFRTDKIVVMGSALSGLTVATLVVQDSGLVGGMAHCPLLDAYATFMAKEPNPRLFLPPVFVKCIGRPGEFALLNTPSSYPGFEAMFDQSDAPFSQQPNLVAPRLAFDMLSSRPGTKLKDAKCPMLVVLAKEDDIIPAELTRKIASEADGKVKLVEAPGEHFDIMKGGQGFDINIRAQLAFLRSLI